MSQPLQEVVQHYLFEGVPAVFDNDLGAYDLLRTHLSKALKVKKRNIVVVGSAKTGFSLDPENFANPFTNASDIDVIIVSTKLFDNVWSTILEWHYPRRTSQLPKIDFQWSQARRKDLYWGWFVPDRIRYTGLSFPEQLQPLRDFSTTWFNAFRSLSRYESLAGREVHGRLYRTWDHAKSYHIDGLRQIKLTLESQGE